MLAWRVASAAAGIPLLLGAAYLGGWPLAVINGLISLLATAEAGRLLDGKASLPRGLLRVWAVAFALAAVWQPDWAVRAALPVAALTLFIRQVILALAAPTSERLESFFTQALSGVFVLIYPAFLLSFLAGLRAAYVHQVVWLILGMVWATDTLAYFGGRVLGGPRLAPVLSPGKTVSGALAGLAGAVAVGFLAGPAAGLGAFYAAGLGVAVGLAAQAGDLFESLLKRVAGVKDTGRLIPGHGGVLDRFDSLAFALPVAYYFLLLTGW